MNMVPGKSRCVMNAVSLSDDAGSYAQTSENSTVADPAVWGDAAWPITVVCADAPRGWMTMAIQTIISSSNPIRPAVGGVNRVICCSFLADCTHGAAARFGFLT